MPKNEIVQKYFTCSKFCFLPKTEIIVCIEYALNLFYGNSGTAYNTIDFNDAYKWNSSKNVLPAQNFVSSPTLTEIIVCIEYASNLYHGNNGTAYKTLDSKNAYKWNSWKKIQAQNSASWPTQTEIIVCIEHALNLMFICITFPVVWIACWLMECRANRKVGLQSYKKAKKNIQ